jgi:hypothetical protein
MLELEDLKSSHTGWSGGRGYLRRGTRKRDEGFENVRGEGVILKL